MEDLISTWMCFPHVRSAFLPLDSMGRKASSCLRRGGGRNAWIQGQHPMPKAHRAGLRMDQAGRRNAAGEDSGQGGGRRCVPACPERLQSGANEPPHGPNRMSLAGKIARLELSEAQSATSIQIGRSGQHRTHPWRRRLSPENSNRTHLQDHSNVAFQHPANWPTTRRWAVHSSTAIAIVHACLERLRPSSNLPS